MIFFFLLLLLLFELRISDLGYTHCILYLRYYTKILYKKTTQIIKLFVKLFVIVVYNLGGWGRKKPHK